MWGVFRPEPEAPLIFSISSPQIPLESSCCRAYRKRFVGVPAPPPSSGRFWRAQTRLSAVPELPTTSLKMNQLSNAFTMLSLDVADSQEETEVAPEGNGKDDEGEKVEYASEEYRLPLVWIDLEMTGLNVEVDTILEIACVITDGSLTKLIEGPDIVISQPKECLDNMGEWCQEHHGASGLTGKVLESTISIEEAEKQVIEFVKRNIGTTYSPLLAGNSVYVDFQFMKKYMPDLANLFSHVLVDVSSVKALCLRWFPRDNKRAPRKENKHRAMDDIKESIAELKYYKDNIFKATRFKK
ncbi:unnamed protein product [Cuscuta epithymum]|uniref:Exonuclease domain-containing protein n=2 Tax=Cuscuta epithymum TaxID=186058 RepID=A0AAV0CGG2_9ASTE|nr:unnamed protein product [Cuscuta epithymum]CAH9121134.1 unnamed protein product [Cuscuta epithymum]